MSEYPLPDPEILQAIRDGMAIPAHPLALNSERRLDERRQKALTRYYEAAGAGGVAVAVHTTQFAIRNPKIGLFRPVLELAAEAAREIRARTGNRLALIAGACGLTEQAAKEATVARELGYDAVLLSLSAFKEATDEEMIAHCREIAKVSPLFGFYLQPSVGGRPLSRSFWRQFAEIPNVVAIKIAPFNRYQTLDVLRGVAESGRSEEIALYTGNDDHILLDLLTEHRLTDSKGAEKRIAFAGGLLGHWAVWTKRAVEQRILASELRRYAADVPADLLSLASAITDANAALFDPVHGFAGCIAGLHEVLRRQGLLEGVWLLDPDEGLSPGQSEEIDRIYRIYPELTDDDFVEAHREEWLR